MILCSHYQVAKYPCPVWGTEREMVSTVNFVKERIVIELGQDLPILDSLHRILPALQC